MTKFRNIIMGTALNGIVLAFAAPAFAQSTPSMQDMWEMLQAQQAKIDSLEAELAVAQVETIEVKKTVEIVADAVEINSGGSFLGGDTQVGGYGELHYEGGSKDEIDLHRFVLFFGHDFTDNIRFFSELEVEHAISGEGKVGEVELEQMYIEMDVNEGTQIYGGVHLVPVGIINETHEPPTFFGVERNAVEKNIIPATWWEGGIGVHGNVGGSGFSYDAMVSSGLNLTATNGYKIRSGRQKVGKAKFKSHAYSGRIQYTGMPGITVASSLYYQPDVTQKTGDSITGNNVSALLWTSHVQAKYRGFGFNALYAAWSLDGADVDASGRDKQNGFYIEPSYTFGVPMGRLDNAKLGVFYRYSDWDNNNGLSNNSGVHRSVFGINYWPIDDVVLKMDYITEKKESGGTSKNAMNLGIGYQF